MKIALVCTEKLPVPPVAGGAIQLYIEGILPYLSPHHDITVFCIEHPKLPPRETRDRVSYIRVKGENKFEYIDNVRKNLSGDFDLIQVFNRPEWVLYLSEAFPQVRFSLSLHNEMFHPEKISGSRAVKCIRRVEFINTVSAFIAEGIRNLYPVAGDKLNVVYSGADAGKYKPVWSEEGIANKQLLKRKHGLRDQKVVLFVGRLGIKKGAHVLLRAMREVMHSRQDVALVIIGSKWYGGNKESHYTKLLEVISMGLTGPIVFTGFIPPSEVPAYYNLGDIFVCPSQWNEPLARVHYEAMAAGLPIITTNRGGNAEIVKGYGNGIVVDDYSNPAAFAESIRYLLDDPAEARKMGMAGRKLAEERYNWERVAADVFRAFGSVVPKLGQPLEYQEEIPEETEAAGTAGLPPDPTYLAGSPVIPVKQEENRDGTRPPVLPGAAAGAPAKGPRVKAAGAAVESPRVKAPPVKKPVSLKRVFKKIAKKARKPLKPFKKLLKKVL